MIINLFCYIKNKIITTFLTCDCYFINGQVSFSSSYHSNHSSHSPVSLRAPPLTPFLQHHLIPSSGPVTKEVREGRVNAEQEGKQRGCDYINN